MKTIWKIMMGLSVFVFAIGTALAQGRTGGPTITPMTAAAKAKAKKSYRLDQAAQAAMDANNYVEAEKDARASLAIGVYSGVNLEILAAALDAQGKTREALLAYKAISDPGGDQPRNELPYALLLLKKGDWTDALAEYNKALPYIGDAGLIREYNTFSPDNQETRELEAAIHVCLGLSPDWRGYNGKQPIRAQALTQFQKAVTLEPSSPLVNYYYGYGLRDAGHGEEAKAAFKKAADLSDGDIKATAEKDLKNL